MFNFEAFARDIAAKAPFKTGWSPSNERATDVEFSIPRAEFDITSAPSLRFLQEEFVLFNHGSLVVFSPTPGDPLRRYCTFNKVSGPVFSLVSPFPLFSGMGEPWDRIIVGCPKQDWAAVRKYLDTDTAVLRDRDLFVRPLSQTKFPIVDFLQMQQHSALPDRVPTVLVEVYGIDSNKMCMHFRPSDNPLQIPPRAIFDKALPETIAVATRLFTGQENPFEQL